MTLLKINMHRKEKSQYFHMKVIVRLSNYVRRGLFMSLFDAKNAIEIVCKVEMVHFYHLGISGMKR